MLGNLLACLPDAEARDQEYRDVITHGLKQMEDSILDNGMLPYWPGDSVGQAFVTAQALWAINEAADAGFAAPEGLADKLRGALTKIVQGRLPASRFEQVFALFALSQPSTSQDLATAAEELYLRRNETGDEGRALLALALHRLAILSKEKEQLLREIRSIEKWPIRGMVELLAPGDRRTPEYSPGNRKLRTPNSELRTPNFDL